jgi:type II restriction enzyme
MKKDFKQWLREFKVSIYDYDYYVNFSKVVENVERIKIELNILNSLIGSKNIEDDFEKIIRLYPETIKCIPLLLAVRSSEIRAKDEDGEFVYRFSDNCCSVEEYKVLCRKTGLFDLISKHIVNNLVDYALGVETGLDSNARKNRGGQQMEKLVERFIQEAGFVKGVNYLKEAYLSDAINKWHFDVQVIVESDRARKRFDFVVFSHGKIYLIETNFYGGYGGGSKLNETARSYKLLGQQLKAVDGVTFIWITDGTAWKNAQSNLKEAFDSLDFIFNINDLENGLLTSTLV